LYRQENGSVALTAPALVLERKSRFDLTRQKRTRAYAANINSSSKATGVL
jgi:hypothetical protein